MNKVKWLFAALCLLIPLAITACNGKSGDRGPVGPGASFDTYTGDIDKTYMTVSAPVLTTNSMVDVRISSETNKWIWTDYDALNTGAKTVSFFATLPGEIGGTYLILVQNPS